LPEEREGAANKGSEGVNRAGTRIVEVTAPPLVLLEAENPLFPVFSNESENVLERLLYTLIGTLKYATSFLNSNPNLESMMEKVL